MGLLEVPAGVCVAGAGTASGLELVSAPVHTRLLAQGAGREIKGSCGHWVSVWCNVTRNSMFGRELEVCPRLLHLVFISKVFVKGTLRRDGIHLLAYSVSVCLSSCNPIPAP